MFAIRHPLVAMIMNRKIYIEGMINDFPAMKIKLEERVEQSLTDYATECADGNNESILSFKHSFMSSYDESRDFDNIFFQAMLIMAYSYYDSVIERLCTENGITNTCNDRICKLCEARNIKLSNDAINCKKFIFDNVKPLRHDIIHNNVGTLRNREKITSLMKMYPEIKEEEGCIILTGPQFVLDTLNKEYEVLYELSQKLGYETEFIGGRK